MKWRLWAQGLAGGGTVLIALSGATAEGQTAFTPERSPMPGRLNDAEIVPAFGDHRAPRSRAPR